MQAEPNKTGAAVTVAQVVQAKTLGTNLFLTVAAIIDV